MADLRRKKGKTVKQMNDTIEIYAYYLTAGLIALLIVILIFMIGYFLFNILSLISIKGGLI